MINTTNTTNEGGERHAFPDVSSLCPVCVHFRRARNYVAAKALHAFVSMCPLFPVQVDTS